MIAMLNETRCLIFQIATPTKLAEVLMSHRNYVKSSILLIINIIRGLLLYILPN